MAIPIARIKEGCCNSDLSMWIMIDGDALDSVGSTCDKIIECSNKYILVEKKSLLFSFFDLCCKEIGQDLETYKDTQNGIIYLRITEVITLVQTIDEEVKKRLLSENIAKLLSSSLKKVSNTTHLLATQYDSTKTADMPIFYLYCKSGKPIDRIMSAWLSRDKKTPFIECTALKNKLMTECS